MKKCCTCGLIKPETEFNKCKGRKDGHQTKCRVCQKAYTIDNAEGIRARRREYNKSNQNDIRIKSRHYYLANKSEIAAKGLAYRIPRRQQLREYGRRYRTENPNKIQANNSRQYQNNRLARQEYGRRYYRANRLRVIKRATAYQAKRSKDDPGYRIGRRLRQRIRSAVRGSPSSVELIGCSCQELTGYLESQFESGMTWDNHGSGVNRWHVDHLLPLSWFDLTDPEELRIATNYMNLRPLWGRDNLRRGKSVAELFRGLEKPMGSFNYIVVVGRLGKDPEVRSTKSGKQVATFSMASDFGFGSSAGTNWHNVVAWDKHAEFAQGHLHKGSMVRLIGELINRKYTDKAGQERGITEIRALDISFFSETKERVANSNESRQSRSAPAQAARPQAQTMRKADPVADTYITDDDIPF